MTSKELYTVLQQAGWGISSSLKQDAGVTWYAWKRLVGATDCSCNDKAPNMTIQLYDIKLGRQNTNIKQVEFEVSGQTADGDWVHFSLGYSNWDDVLGDAEKASKVLRKAWEAVAKGEL